MPAPRPSIDAITDANAGRPSGAASATSSICPTTTPISAPTSVADHRGPRAEQERRAGRSRCRCRQLADRRVLLGADVDQHAARGELRRRSSPPARRRRSAPRRRPSRSALGIGAVAHVDGGEPAVRGDRPALGERVADRRRTPLSVLTFASAASTAAFGPGSVILPSSTLKTSVESAPANAGLCALKRSIAFWVSVPGAEKSSAASPPAPAAMPSRTITTKAPSGAHLPVVRQGAREAREEHQTSSSPGSGRVGRRQRVLMKRPARAVRRGDRATAPGAATITVAPIASAATPIVSSA